jgi:tripartite-type tricarboxylate transporter receptor subunit TctC
VLRLLGSQSDLGRTIVAGPGVPRERADALRDGVAAMVKDPAFLADAARLGIEINYKSGSEISDLVSSLMSVSPSVIERARSVTAN